MPFTIYITKRAWAFLLWVPWWRHQHVPYCTAIYLYFFCFIWLWWEAIALPDTAVRRRRTTALDSITHYMSEIEKSKRKNNVAPGKSGIVDYIYWSRCMYCIGWKSPNFLHSASQVSSSSFSLLLLILIILYNYEIWDVLDPSLSFSPRLWLIKHLKIRDSQLPACIENNIKVQLLFCQSVFKSRMKKKRDEEICLCFECIRISPSVLISQNSNKYLHGDGLHSYI